MISKSILNAVLAKALSTGADFAEVFAERTLSKNISMIDSKVSEITDSLLSGVGIRILLVTSIQFVLYLPVYQMHRKLTF